MVHNFLNSLVTLSRPLMSLIMPSAAQFGPEPSVACMETAAAQIHSEDTLVFAFFLLPLMMCSPSLYPYHIIYCISDVHLGFMFGSCAPYFVLILSYSSPALFPLSFFSHTNTHTHLLTD